MATKADLVAFCYILRSLNTVVAIHSIQRPVAKSQPCYTISFLKQKKISPEASLDLFSLPAAGISNFCSTFIGKKG